MDFNLSFTAFIGLCGLGAWFFFQRQVRLNDKEQTEKDEETKSKFKEQGLRIGALADRCQKLELELSTKVGREELDKLYDKVDEVRREFKEDLKDLKVDLLAAINRLVGHGG